MKLIDLDAAGTRQRYDNHLSVGFSDDVFEQLKPYRENREAAGFVRLAVGVLLALVSSDVDKVKYVVDELACVCDSTDALNILQENCYVLDVGLKARLMAIEHQGD